VGGENVYCSEVEAALQRHDAVAQAAVFGTPHPVLGELVAAAVVLRPGAFLAPGATTSSGGGSTGSTSVSAGSAALIEWCRTQLAHYKVPSVVHVLDALPTTGSGKVLKRQLRDMLGSAPATAAAASTASAAAAPAAHGDGQPLVQLAVPGVSAEQLARAATALLGAGAQLIALDGSGTQLDGTGCYVLPLTDALPLLQQLALALVGGARSVLLLAGSPLDCAAIDAIINSIAPGAVAAVAVIDAPIASSPQRLLHALYSTRPAGVGPFWGALLPPAAQLPVMQLPSVPGAALSELASRVVAALGDCTRVVELGMGGVSSDEELLNGGSWCHVLPVAGGVALVDQVGWTWGWLEWWYLCF